MGGSSLPEAGSGKRRKRALEISRLQTTPVGAGSPAEALPVKSLTVTLTMGERGYVIATSAGATIEIPVVAREGSGVQYDLKVLAERLKKLKSEFPDQAAITLAADDGVIYADLVHTIDACVGAGLANVSIMGAG